MRENDNAFPIFDQRGHADGCRQGVTLKEYFSGLAMQTIVRSTPTYWRANPSKCLEAARASVLLGEAMLKALAESEK